MNLNLNKKEKELFDFLWTIPPSYEEAKHYICENAVAKESITKVAIEYVEQCSFDVTDYFGECNSSMNLADVLLPQGVIPGLHSTHILDVIKLLLEYGLDPNAVVKTETGSHNIMLWLDYIENEYLGVDALALLLENGGDPNLSIDGFSMYNDAVFEVWFGAVEQMARWRYNISVHRWMVLAAYGGKSEEDTGWPKVFQGYDENQIYGKWFDIKDLREHRNFYFGLSFEDEERTLHIYDKSFWKVAECR